MTMNNLQKKNKRALDRLESSFERELIANYQTALKEIRAKLSKANEDFNLDWVEMQRYNRLAKLEKEIAQEIAKLTGKNAKTLKKGMMDVYEDSYYRSSYFLTNAVKSDLGFVLLDRKLVEKAIENPLDRVGFLQRNRDNQARLTRQLREHLSQGLIQGQSYRTVAKTMKNRMDIGASKALTIARTENHRTRQQGKLDSMKEGEAAGVVLKKQWLSSMDGSTRDSHQELDGVQVNLDEDFEGEEGSGPMPGMMGSAAENINCRCEIIEVVAGFEPKQRRVKGVGITEYTTYKEFKNSLA